MFQQHSFRWRGGEMNRITWVAGLLGCLLTLASVVPCDVEAAEEGKAPSLNGVKESGVLDEARRLYRQGKYLDSLQKFEVVEREFDTNGSSSRDMFFLKLFKGNALKKTNQPLEAEREYQLAIEELPFLHAESTELRVMPYAELADLHKKQERWEKAQENYLLELAEFELADSEVEEMPLEEAIALQGLSLSYLKNKQFADAIPHLERLLADGPGGKAARNAVLVNLGLCCERIGELRRAAGFYEELVRLGEEEGFLLRDNAALCSSYSALVNVYMAQHKWEEANAVIEKWQRVLKSTLFADADANLEASTLQVKCLRHLHKFDEAKQLAEPLLETPRSRESPQAAVLADELCMVEICAGEWDSAEQRFKDLLSKCENSAQVDEQELLLRLSNLWTFYVCTHRQSQAVQYCERAADIAASSQSLAAENRCLIFQNLAVLWDAQGQHQRAAKYHELALEEVSNMESGQDFFRAQVLAGGVINKWFLGQREDASKSIDEALAIFSQVASDAPQVATSVLYLNAGLIRAAQGQWDSATEKLEQGLGVLLQMVREEMLLLTEEEQRRYLEFMLRPAYDRIIATCLTATDSKRATRLAALTAINAKALGLETAGRVSKFFAVEENRSKIEQLRAVRTALATLAYGQEYGSRLDEEIVSLGKKERSLRRSLAVFPEQGERLIEPSEIVGQLSSGEVFIDFMKVQDWDLHAETIVDACKPERYCAWVYRSQDSEGWRFFDLGLAERIDQRVGAMVSEIQEAVTANGGGKKSESSLAAQIKERARSLSAILLKPILAEIDLSVLGENGRVTISPDSTLWMVPWNALPLEDDTFLVEKFIVRTVTSGREFVLDRGATTVGEQGDAVVFANPTFGAAYATAQGLDAKAFRGQISQRTVERKNFAPLPGTLLETARVAPQLAILNRSKPKTFLGREASESHVKDLSRPRIVHFATHGFFEADEILKNEGGPIVELYRLGGESLPLFTPDGELAENPWVRCGLCFAGCNEPLTGSGEEDGILTGLEVLSLDFQGTELVVLSACDSGVGQVRCGEGAAGLRQAFLLAGANSVIGSLWAVGDDSTAALMGDFFAQVNAGLGFSEALAKAQRAAIKRLRTENGVANPTRWAAFSLTGKD